jgi:DNA (cytosine-5)-methyltransferase 1
MRVAHLFSGAGGGLLADLILGHTPVLAIEWNKACCDSLRERVEEGWLPGLHVHHGDVRDFDWGPWAGKVDCLAAGFPCQDISSAGGGAGIKDKRSGLGNGAAGGSK